MYLLVGPLFCKTKTEATPKEKEYEKVCERLFHLHNCWLWKKCPVSYSVLIDVVKSCICIWHQVVCIEDCRLPGWMFSIFSVAYLQVDLSQKECFLFWCIICVTLFDTQSAFLAFLCRIFSFKVAFRLDHYGINFSHLCDTKAVAIRSSSRLG